MGDIEALRGVWNIVPTPFTPDGAVDTASIPGLVGFVRGTGVDGMTILGVLGEAGRLGDAERTTVLEAVLAAAAGSIPVCVGVSHASTDRAIALAREAQAAGAHSVMLAPPPLARPTDAALRRHYLAVAEAVDVPDRRPGPPGELRGPDDVRLPARPRRRGAALPRDQARGGAHAAQGRAPRRRLARRHRARRPRRRDAARGAPPRQPRDDDRVRVPGGAGGRGPALVRGRPGRRGGRVRPLRDADPVREPGAAQPADPQGRVPAARGDGPQRRCGRRACRPIAGTLADLDDVLRRTGLDGHLAAGSVLPSLLA